MRIVRGRACGSVCVASTCSTSLVPIPKASAPNAPCVEVCESPQTIVIPGWVTPSSGPIGSDSQGIVHVIGPELGVTQPGMTIVCGDRVQRDAELGAVLLERPDL